jgi:uncharacterized membrane protein
MAHAVRKSPLKIKGGLGCMRDGGLVMTAPLSSVSDPVPDPDEKNAVPGAALFPYASNIQSVQTADCWHWLALGWKDLSARPVVSIAYGSIFVAGGLLLTVGLKWLGMLYLITPLIAGFLLVAPALSVGLYELSRRREQGEALSFFAALWAWRRNTFHLLTAGLVLMLFLMIWVRLAALIFAVSFPYTNMTMAGIIGALWSWDGAAFLAIGTAVGGVLALVAFVFGALSLPMMVDRRVDVFSAAIVSAQAVARNRKAMLLWAAILVSLSVIGFLSAFIGLAVVLPLLGHATWHAYRAMVIWPDS